MITVGRYRDWLLSRRLTWPAGGALAFFAGLGGLLAVAGGLLGAVLGGFPRGRVTGLVLVAWGAVCVVLAYRIVRGPARNAEVLLLAVWWLPFGRLDAWANDLPHRSRWPLVGFALLAWLLVHSARQARKAPGPEPAADVPAPVPEAPGQHG